MVHASIVRTCIYVRFTWWDFKREMEATAAASPPPPPALQPSRASKRAQQQQQQKSTQRAKENNYKWIMIFIIYASSFSFSYLVHFLWSTNIIRLAVSGCCLLPSVCVCVYAFFPLNSMLQPVHKNDRYDFFSVSFKMKSNEREQRNKLTRTLYTDWEMSVIWCFS